MKGERAERVGVREETWRRRRVVVWGERRDSVN